MQGKKNELVTVWESYFFTDKYHKATHTRNENTL